MRVFWKSLYSSCFSFFSLLLQPFPNFSPNFFCFLSLFLFYLIFTFFFCFFWLFRNFEFFWLFHKWANFLFSSFFIHFFPLSSLPPNKYELPSCTYLTDFPFFLSLLSFLFLPPFFPFSKIYLLSLKSSHKKQTHKQNKPNKKKHGTRFSPPVSYATTLSSLNPFNFADRTGSSALGLVWPCQI